MLWIWSSSYKKVGGLCVAIIKPRSNEEIIKRIRMAEEAGAIAVGVDLDGAGLVTMKLFGQPVRSKNCWGFKRVSCFYKTSFYS